MSMASAEDNDTIDGELASRVILLMNVCQSKKDQVDYSENSFDVKLERGFLFFMQSFRKMYIGDSSMTSTRVLLPPYYVLIGFLTHHSGL